MASSFGSSADIACDVLVLGGGPGGYSAAFRAADLGLNVVIVERYATLGGVCLNVGCIPSKALLHVAAVMDEVAHMADLGVDFGAPVVNIDKLRGHKEKVIGKLTGGLAAMAKMRKVTTVRGLGQFVGANHLEVSETTGTAQEQNGSKKVIAFKKAIIAAGSQAVRLPFMPNDPRVVDSTGALELKEVPKRMLILGDRANKAAKSRKRRHAETNHGSVVAVPTDRSGQPRRSRVPRDAIHEVAGAGHLISARTTASENMPAAPTDCERITAGLPKHIM